MDFSKCWEAEEIGFLTNASKNPKLVCGGWCGKQWFSQQWEEDFIGDEDPSIAYLELFAVAVGLKLWLHKFKNKRIIIKCDNQATVQMINNSSSSCKNCMVLIRVIVLHSLIHNVRVFASYVSSAKNEIADSLSRVTI